MFLDEEDFIFKVDALLDKRTVKKGRSRVTEYLVKWAGYGHEHNTWEPAKHIDDPALIADLDDILANRQAHATTRRSARKRRRESD